MISQSLEKTVRKSQGMNQLDRERDTLPWSIPPSPPGTHGFINARNAGYAGLKLGEANFVCDFEISLFGVNKEVVGIHDVLTRSLFGDGIPRRLLLRVSLAKPTSAPLRS